MLLNDYIKREAIVAGLLCSLLVSLRIFFPLQFCCAASLFVAFVSYGNAYGLQACAVAVVCLLIESALGIFPSQQALWNATLLPIVDLIVPVGVVGYCFLQKKVVGRKTWWYPESFLLRNFTILCALVAMIYSVTQFSPDQMIPIVEEAAKTIQNMLGANNNINIDMIKRGMMPWAKVFSGIYVLSNAMGLLINFAIALKIAEKLQRKQRNFDLTTLQLHPFLGAAPLVLLTAAILLPSVGHILGSAAIAMTIGPLITGLVSIHRRISQQHAQKTLMIYGSILLLALFFPTLLSILFLLAIIVGISNSLRNNDVG